MLNKKKVMLKKEMLKMINLKSMFKQCLRRNSISCKVFKIEYINSLFCSIINSLI